MSRQDLKGYYAVLGVPFNATSTEIKAAFRHRAKQLHPDHNSSLHAAGEFQQLNEAYEVLIDSESRAQYDTAGIEVPQHIPQTSHSKISHRELLEPLTCSLCHKVTAQPRYIILYQVKSFIAVTFRTPIQGIFCRDCAEEKLLRSSVITWLLGFWGFPYGVIFSSHAIVHNLFGGSKPNDVNARLLTYQAYVFATQGKIDLARAVGADALDVARRIKPGISAKLQKAIGRTINDEGAKLQSTINELLAAIDTGRPIQRISNTWSGVGRAFYLQCAMIASTALVAFTFLMPKSPISTQASISQTSQGTSPVISQSSPKPSESASSKPLYVRPVIADNGMPFPTISGYVDGYQFSRNDGYSKLTIDNSQNDSDVFVKLFSLDQVQAKPVRVFFIRAAEKFTLEDITAGNYDVRYRNLDSGTLSRSEPIQLKEFRTDSGVRFSNVTITLYKVIDGNMETYPISEAEF